MATETRKELEVSRYDIAELRKANEALQLQLKEATGQRGSQAKVQLNPADRELINKVKADEEQLQARLGNLEGALMNTPEKALSTLVIKQQVDALQDRSRGDMESVHGEMGRLFTLTEWCLGLMFTIALGVFGPPEYSKRNQCQENACRVSRPEPALPICHSCSGHRCFLDGRGPDRSPDLLSLIIGTRGCLLIITDVMLKAEVFRKLVEGRTPSSARF